MKPFPPKQITPQKEADKGVTAIGNFLFTVLGSGSLFKLYIYKRIAEITVTEEDTKFKNNLVKDISKLESRVSQSEENDKKQQTAISQLEKKMILHLIVIKPSYPALLPRAPDSF